MKEALKMVYKFSSWIANHPKIVIIITAVLLIPAVMGFLFTGINYDILSYLPEDLESVQAERILDKSFNCASSSFLIIKDTNSKRLEKLRQKIEKVDGVNSVMGITSIADPSIPPEILPDILSSVFYSADGKSSLMMVQYTDSGASDRTMNAIEEIRGLLDENSAMSGISTLTLDTKIMADEQAPVFIAIAVALALVVLSFTMNSFVLPFILLLALGIAVVFNMGTNIFFGSISYITQCIAAILQLGVTMDYSVFLLDRYEEERPKWNGDNKKAMSYAIEQTFTSLAGSSLTTVFGFVALCFMQFTLGMDIGIVMAKGVIIGVISVVTILPALILLMTNIIDKTRHRSLIPPFNRLSNFTIKHRKVFTALFFILFIPAFLIQSRLTPYYDMVKAMPEEMGSVKALSQLKESFDMASTHFIICDADMSPSDSSRMINEIKEVDGITKILALPEFIGPGIDMGILPDEIRDICIAKIDDGRSVQLMMVNSGYSATTDKANDQIKKVYDIIKKYDSKAYLTGEGVLEKDLIEVTNKDFVVTSIISIAAIFILILIFTKSVSLPVILVMGIELAIMINKAVSVLTGADVSFIDPTVIGCVQLGATVDYAILVATRFKEEIQKCGNKIEAMKIAAPSASRSVVQSSLVFFAATFGVYIFCDISIIKNICSMLARGSIISAAVIILFVTPALVCLEGIINKTSYKWRNRKDNEKGENYEKVC